MLLKTKRFALVGAALSAAGAVGVLTLGTATATPIDTSHVLHFIAVRTAMSTLTDALMPQGNPRDAKIVARRFPAHSSRLLNAPQRPAQPAQCDDLFSFFSAQDVAHDHRG